MFIEREKNMATNVIQNIELKIISILQGSTNKENRMSIKELTARVYAWDELDDKDGTIRDISEKEIDEWICKGSETVKQKAHRRYERIRIIRDSIFNILKNYKKNFPIKIYAPLVIYEEDEKERKKAFYIDEDGLYSEKPIYKEKLIFMTEKESQEKIDKEIKKISKILSEKEQALIAQNVIDNSIELWMDDIKNKNAFPEINDWQIYYQQSYTNVEAFVILSSLVNQNNIESRVVNEIICKLIKSTSDKSFEQFVKNINLDFMQTTMADEYLSNDDMEWHVLTNIQKIMKAIAMKKKINFDRIYYEYNYEKKQLSRKSVFERKNTDKYREYKQYYQCTPFYIFLEDGRYWLLAVKDNYNTTDGNFMPCPLDLITNISILEEDGYDLEELKFINKYDGVVEKKRIKEYMKTNYEKPEEFEIKVYRNQTSGNLILRTFGRDFLFVESTEDYDVIKVIRSPFGMLNWALVNTRDVELIPKTEETKQRLSDKINELNQIYKRN